MQDHREGIRLLRVLDDRDIRRHPRATAITLPPVLSRVLHPRVRGCPLPKVKHSPTRLVSNSSTSAGAFGPMTTIGPAFLTLDVP